MQVVGDTHVTTHMQHDDDDDADMMQVPVPSTQHEVEPMTVDQTGNDQIISPPSDFESLDPRQDFVHASEPAFDIDDTWSQAIWMRIRLRTLCPGGLA